MATASDIAAAAHVAPSSSSCPFARLVTRGEEAPAEAAIGHWLRSGCADDFPYDAVVAEFHRAGKHLVAPALLETLAGARAALPRVRGSIASVALLERFLDTALDKWDGRYANPTYLGLSLLPLPTLDDLDQAITVIERQYDRLLVQLIADASRFEIAAADGATGFLPRMRPDARITAKRCRLGLQIAGPAARRLGMDAGIDVADPIAGARHLWANVAAEISIAERRALRLTMLPVSVVHDEYQFIRVLQAFEATFALVAVQLRAAVQALSEDRCDVAPRHVQAAATALREVAPLFSLIGTMAVEAFQTFRVFTEGASAIQSRNYKLVESLCRRPDASRLDSAAYLSAPEVRRRVLAGQVTLDDAFSAARDSGCLAASEVAELELAMREFATTLQRWRRTHHRIAVRMLGENTGTGYTAGAAYLAAVQTISVFATVALEEDSEARDDARGDERAPMPARAVMPAPGRCPFAGGLARSAG
jgi:tryptophan 2,3-dioxygenase